MDEGFVVWSLITLHLFQVNAAVVALDSIRMQSYMISANGFKVVDLVARHAGGCELRRRNRMCWKQGERNSTVTLSADPQCDRICS